MSKTNGGNPTTASRVSTEPVALNAAITAALGSHKAELVLKNICYLNVFTGEWLHGDIAICGGKIAGIGEYEGHTEIDGRDLTCVPGFIDGHIHLESAMVTPPEFARSVIPHGTTAVVADPHEIVNVLGRAGLEYMLKVTEDLPLDVFFMLPSCVPATRFDENGAEFSLADIETYLSHPRVTGLGEMMDYNGVLSLGQGVLAKICAAHHAGKPVDGHAPGLTGKNLSAYIAAGINTDHECTSAKEAMEKLRMGQWIMIREGSAARNLTALLPLFHQPYALRCLLVTDDKHPGDLISQGHIDHLIRKAILLGADPAAAYTMASFNAAQCFRFHHLGAIAPGYQADLVLLDDVKAVAIHCVYKAGQCVFSTNQKPAISLLDESLASLGKISIGSITEASFRLGQAKVIGLVPGQLLTTDNGFAHEVNPSKDIVKVAVIERHKATEHIGLAYLQAYGLQKGAIATSVAHDSHNLIVAGVHDADMALAANHIAKLGGGMAVVLDGKVLADLALPIAGLMSPKTAADVHQALEQLLATSRGLGVSKGVDPFMTLSFVSLPVIPALRLTTLGVVDVAKSMIVK